MFRLLLQSHKKCYIQLTMRYRVRNVVEHVITYKVKSVPLQVWSGPEDSKKLRFPYFITATQDGGKDVSLTHRPTLPPRNAPGTHFC